MLKSQKQEDQELKAILHYRMSFRLAWASQQQRMRAEMDQVTQGPGLLCILQSCRGTFDKDKSPGSGEAKGHSKPAEQGVGKDGHRQGFCVVLFLVVGQSSGDVDVVSSLNKGLSASDALESG